MITNIKKHVKEFISAEVQRAVLKNRSTGTLPSWNDLIAINPDYKTFKPLDEVSRYRDGETYINPDSLGLESDLDEYIRRDSYPLPSTEDREGYMGDRHFEFWLFGLSDYIKIKKALKQSSLHLRPGSSVYEMGAASGRVIRHFQCQENDLDLWASDINRNHVEWISKYLKGVKAFQNNSIPHLPFDDRSFDLAYAFSVFSHIEAFETGWLMELRRILKIGGIAYLTIHSEHTWEIMNENMPIYQALLAHPDFSPDHLNSSLPREKMVFQYRGGSYGANVFYHSDYIQNIWGNFLEILDIVREGSFYQDVVLLRRKE